MRRPELLAPAGDGEKLRYAVRYGADAVYLAGGAYGMRANAGNFTPDELRAAIAHCHAHGVRAFVTVNTMPRSDELGALPAYLESLCACGADAVIVSDMGVLALAKKHAPDMRVHLSTQASVVNHAAARAYHDLGCDRIVLARELSLDEIADIRAKTPRTLELEVFAHGAMCVSYSGRCLLSNYLTGRDANRGQCAQACRWKYRLVEEKRPGEYLPVFEDETGTYVFNARDLCMIDHLPALIATGVDSLKLEGRAKSFYYTAAVTNAYRRALDLCALGHPVPPELSDEVRKVSHREYSTGFYFGRAPDERHSDSDYLRGWSVAATVERCDAQGHAELIQRNRFSHGDEAELLMPGVPAVRFALGRLTDENGADIDSARHPKMAVRLTLPCAAPPMSIIRIKTGDGPA